MSCLATRRFLRRSPSECGSAARQGAGDRSAVDLPGRDRENTKSLREVDLGAGCPWGGPVFGVGDRNISCRLRALDPRPLESRGRIFATRKLGVVEARGWMARGLPNQQPSRI